MNFHSEAIVFLEKLMNVLEKAKVRIEPYWDIDHLCFRVATQEKYEELKPLFLDFSTLLIESEVNGRMISTFKLFEPIKFRSWVIDLVELPAPKKGKKTIEGFEHVEVVSDLSFEEIEKRFSHLKLDRGGLEKELNQELEICLGDINLKFHPLSLESVINLEKNQKVLKAIETSQVLEKLKKYRPLVAGTFLLGLDVETSDVDVLLEVQDHTLLAQELKAEFCGFPNFSHSSKTVDGIQSTVSRFEVDTVPFEIFAQQQPAVKQRTYQHFLVEERLLKVKGPGFKDQVLELRQQGLKTESAFAKALGLHGDPKEALLKFRNSEISAY